MGRSFRSAWARCRRNWTPRSSSENKIGGTRTPAESGLRAARTCSTTWICNSSRTALRRTIRNIQAEFYLRPALAFGCLLFALLGCPVGIWANRADYLSTFVICFLPALFVYYPLLLAGSGMGKDGKLPLGLGCWLANIVVGIAAIVLNARLLRR